MQMINSTFTTIFLVLPFIIYSQTYYQGDTVFVEACTNCFQNNATYGQAQAFHTRNIISDFGPRNYPSSFWHGGVDYTAEGIEDHGYHILAVEGGTIRRMRAGAGQKYPEIIGPNMHLMYNHCFTSDDVGTGMREGDLELTLLDAYGNDPFYQFGLIQYRENDKILIAACPQNNCELSYKLMNRDTTGYSYDTISITPLQIDSTEIIEYDTVHPVNTVTKNQVIGSLGTSSGTNTTSSVPSHLHLQRFRNPTGGYGKANLIDPLEEVRHQGPEYDIKILKNEGMSPNFLEGVNISYPGSNASAMLVRPIMPDVDTHGNNNNGHGDNYIYFNNTMNIDRVELKVKNYSQSEFNLIQGPKYDSKIWLGARYNHDKHYPATSEDNVHNHEGSWTRHTMKPYCYSNRNGRWDDYFFTDFVTRIHRDDPMDGSTTPTMITGCPDEARYPDGEYEVYAGVTDVRDNDYYSDTLTFVLDNFAPYVQQLTLASGGSTFYANEWICAPCAVNNGLSYSQCNPSGVQINLSDITATVTLSEPMDTLTAWLNDSLLNITASSPTQYTLDIGSRMADAFSCDGPVLYRFRFQGQDLGGNDILDLSDYVSGGCATIPTRSSNEVMSNPDALPMGRDTIHRLYFTCDNNRSTLYSDACEISIPAGRCRAFIAATVTSIEDCSNAGSILIDSLSNGSNICDIAWDDGSTDSLRTDLSEGTYCVTVTGDQCCSFTRCFDITKCANTQSLLENGIYIINRDNINFCGEESGNEITSCDGGIEIYIDDDNWDFTYTTSWTGPGSIQTMGDNLVSVCEPGLYTFTISTDNCCTYSISDIICCCSSGVIIAQTLSSGGVCPPEGFYDFTLSGEISPITQGNNGAIDLLIDPGTTYSYQWEKDGNFYSDDRNISNLGEGEYCVTATNGCVDRSDCWELQSCEGVVIQANENIVDACTQYPVGQILINPTGGTAPYSYQWDNETNNAQISNLAEGQYCVTITDRYQCYVEECYTVGANNPQIYESSDPCGYAYYCNGSQVDFQLQPVVGSFNDPFNCNIENYYCSVNQEHLGWRDWGYIRIRGYISNCAFEGYCASGAGWEFIDFGDNIEVYRGIGIDPNCGCATCYYSEGCVLDYQGRRIRFVDYNISRTSYPTSINRGETINCGGLCQYDLYCDGVNARTYLCADCSFGLTGGEEICEQNISQVLKSLYDQGMLGDATHFLLPEGVSMYNTYDELRDLATRSVNDGGDTVIMYPPLDSAIALADIVVENNCQECNTNIDYLDCDGDCLTNAEELTGIDDPLTPKSPGGIITDPLIADTDNDGTPDGGDYTGGTEVADCMDNNCNSLIDEEENHLAWIVWTGCQNSDWHNPDNWSYRRIPYYTDTVYIPTNPGGGNYPVVTGEAEVSCLRIGTNAHLTIAHTGFMSVTGGSTRMLTAIYNQGVIICNGTMGVHTQAGTAITIAYNASMEVVGQCNISQYSQTGLDNSGELIIRQGATVQITDHSPLAFFQQVGSMTTVRGTLNIVKQ